MRTVILTVIFAIILFCLLIFPHELGHFIAAKRLGVKVNEFAFGMGPAVWKHQKGETLYAIRIFPIGGYCSMEGEDEDTGDPRAFTSKKPWQKLIILLAGPVMNVLCAILVMSLILGISGFTTNRIGEVTESSPAEAGGLQAGDRIVEIDGEKISSWNDVLLHMPDEEREMEITVRRKGGTQTLRVTPQLEQTFDEDGQAVSERYIMGITSKISHSPVTSVIGGCQSTWNLFKMIFQSFTMLFTGEAGMNDLTGPVGMVEMVSEATQIGLWYYGFLVALICVNLAIVNLLPLPALDGGRIVFVLITMITGKKVSEKVEGTIHVVGLALLIALMVYVTFNDVTRIFLGGA